MTKALRKAMMHRKKLRNRYIKSRTEDNLKAFKTQRNFCVKLLRKTKSDYYRNLDLGDLADNRKFWRTVKPVFSNEVQKNSSVALMEDGKMITEDLKIAEIFNHYYVGFMSTTLSQLFNKHRHDAGHDPTSTELSKHFYGSKNCKFERDLKVHVLE